MFIASGGYIDYDRFFTIHKLLMKQRKLYRLQHLRKNAMRNAWNWLGVAGVLLMSIGVVILSIASVVTVTLVGAFAAVLGLVIGLSLLVVGAILGLIALVIGIV